MAKPVSRTKAEQVLVAAAQSKQLDMWKYWPLLPRGLNLELVRHAMAATVRSGHDIGVIGRALDDSYIDVLLEVSRTKPRWVEAVAAESVAHVAKNRSVALGQVIKAIGQLGVFSASRSQLEARVRVFAKQAHIVDAARNCVQVAVFDELRRFHRNMLISVLMEDASEESIDALLPDVHAALNAGTEQLDALKECLRWRKPPKPALAPIAQLLTQQVEAHGGQQALPALSVSIGLKRTPTRLAFYFYGLSRPRVAGATAFTVEIDTSAAQWFSVRCSHGARGKKWAAFEPTGRSGAWSAVPDLKSFVEWPAWLKAVKALTGFEVFDEVRIVRCSVRGGDRERLEQWLTG